MSILHRSGGWHRLHSALPRSVGAFIAFLVFGTWVLAMSISLNWTVAELEPTALLGRLRKTASNGQIDLFSLYHTRKKSDMS